MEQILPDIVKEQFVKKNLHLHIDADVYSIEGFWLIQSSGQSVTIADLPALRLSFNYLVDIDGVNHVLYPDDTQHIRDQVSKLRRGEHALFNFRIIAAEGFVQSATGTGTLVHVNHIPIADWDENTSRQEIELKSFQYAEKVSDSGTWTWNLTTGEYYCSENLYHVLGIPNTNQRLDLGSFTQLLHAKDRERIAKLMIDMKQRKQNVDIEFRIFLRGETHYVKMKAEPFTTRKGDEYYIGTTRDVTREVQAERYRKETQKRINDELANFAFISSHDLREPLRKIQLFTTALIDRDPARESDRARNFAERILNSVQRMNDLIEDILNYSKISSQARSKYVNTDLNQLLHQVLDECHETIQNSGAHVICNKLPIIKCNALQMSQLFQNLISNALKFQDGRRNPKIQIDGKIVPAESIDSPLVDGTPQYLRLEFSDNGIGIEEKYLEKIFGIFQRLHTQGIYPGTGMGLAICKKVVENHKGFMMVKSTVGKGSVFVCYFPVLENTCRWG